MDSWFSALSTAQDRQDRGGTISVETPQQTRGSLSTCSSSGSQRIIPHLQSHPAPVLPPLRTVSQPGEGQGWERPGKTGAHVSVAARASGQESVESAAFSCQRSAKVLTRSRSCPNSLLWCRFACSFWVTLTCSEAFNHHKVDIFQAPDRE